MCQGGDVLFFILRTPLSILSPEACEIINIMVRAAQASPDSVGFIENKNHSTYFVVVVVVAAQLRITSGRLPRIWGSISHRALSALGTSHYTAFITSGAATAFIKAEPRDAREGEGDIIRCPRNVLYG
jgi:hypothetical protein